MNIKRVCKLDVMKMKIGENLSIYMDGMPLEGNVVLSCVQQDGLGHVSCLAF